jgi:hypothetical protein
MNLKWNLGLILFQNCLTSLKTGTILETCAAYLQQTNRLIRFSEENIKSKIKYLVNMRLQTGAHLPCLDSIVSIMYHHAHH